MACPPPPAPPPPPPPHSAPPRTHPTPATAPCSTGARRPPCRHPTPPARCGAGAAAAPLPRAAVCPPRWGRPAGPPLAPPDPPLISRAGHLRRCCRRCHPPQQRPATAGVDRPRKIHRRRRHLRRLPPLPRWRCGEWRRAWRPADPRCCPRRSPGPRPWLRSRSRPRALTWCAAPFRRWGEVSRGWQMGGGERSARATRHRRHDLSCLTPACGAGIPARRHCRRRPPQTSRLDALSARERLA
jgi:hypothetical protein